MPRIIERLEADERPELVLAPRQALARLERVGAMVGNLITVGSVGVGIAVRQGAPGPVITDERSLRVELEAADAVVFDRASTGLHMEQLFARPGLADAVAAKSVRFPDGDAVLRRLQQDRISLTG